MIENADPEGRDGRDELGRFAKGNAGGPGRPLGRRDRIAAALEALREHYKAADQAEAVKAFVGEIVKGFGGNGERLDLLRLLLPKESTIENVPSQDGELLFTMRMVGSAAEPRLPKTIEADGRAG